MTSVLLLDSQPHSFDLPLDRGEFRADFGQVPALRLLALVGSLPPSLDRLAVLLANFPRDAPGRWFGALREGCDARALLLTLGLYAP